MHSYSYDFYIGGEPGIAPNGVMGGAGGGLANRGGGGGGGNILLPGGNPASMGNGGNGANGANGDIVLPGGAGGILTQILKNETDKPNRGVAPGTEGSPGMAGGGGIISSGGGGSSANFLITAPKYTINQTFDSSSNYTGTKAGAGGMSKDLDGISGSGGGGVTFYFEGIELTVAAGAQISAGGVSLGSNYVGGGGGAAIAMNSGSFINYGRLFGGASYSVEPPGYNGVSGSALVANTGVHITNYNYMESGTSTGSGKPGSAVYLAGSNITFNNHGLVSTGIRNLNDYSSGSLSVVSIGNNNYILNNGNFRNSTVDDRLGFDDVMIAYIEGDNNTFAFTQKNKMDGYVLSVGTGNTLELTGDTNVVFNASRITNLKAQGNFLDFQKVHKTGTSTWSVNNQPVSLIPWIIDEGVIELVDDGSLELASQNSYINLHATLDISKINYQEAILHNLIMENGSIIVLDSKDLKIENLVNTDVNSKITGYGNVSFFNTVYNINKNLEYTGNTIIDNGQLNLFNAGNILGDVEFYNNSKLNFTKDDDYDFANLISGEGGIEKYGQGITTLSGNNTYTGSSDLFEGQLEINGDQSGATGDITVHSGASLSGTGTIGGIATIMNGGTLMGRHDTTLNFKQNLTLNATSIIDVSLGAHTAPALFHVDGDLVLDGILSIDDLGGFGPGLHRLFYYGGNFLDNGLTIGLVPNDLNASSIMIQTSQMNEVNLIHSGVAELSIWDGGNSANKDNGRVDGGDGIWNLNDTNWTDGNGAANGIWENGSFAIFSAEAGTVTVDNTGGDIAVSGMHFASSGYRLEGDAISLNDDDGSVFIRVGDGSVLGKSIFSTIANNLDGDAKVIKSDYGTIIFAGENTYTGGTQINEGSLQIGEGGTSGSILGDVVNNATLAFNRSDDVVFTGEISGKGSVVQRGTGSLTLSGANSFSGGLTVEKGIARAAIERDAFGRGLLNIFEDAVAELDSFDTTVGGLTGRGELILGDGTLTLEQVNDTVFSGVISGSGGLIKNGEASITLSGKNNYTGDTDVNNGFLYQGTEGALSGDSNYNIGLNGSVDLGGFNTNLGNLSNAGRLYFGGKKPGTNVIIDGDYQGNNGTIVLNAELNGDTSSQADILKITGTATGSTNVEVINRRGRGALTLEGIRVIEIDNPSDGIFNLQGDFVTKDGEQAVISGAYAYTLHKNGLSTPDDGHWYLRSASGNGNAPVHPIYSPTVPIYEGYNKALRSLNKLPTLRERVGNRYFNRMSDSDILQEESTTPSQEFTPSGLRYMPQKSVFWGRVEGAHSRFGNNGSSLGILQNMNTFLVQAGLDGQLAEYSTGKVIGGLTMQYGNAKSKIYSDIGDGNIKTNSWALGGTLSWYSNHDFYIDAQAQAIWFNSDLYSEVTRSTIIDNNKTNGYAFSIEGGKRIEVSPYWSLIPQAQLSWSSLGKDSFTDIWSADINLNNNSSAVGRIGISAHYDQTGYDERGMAINKNIYGIMNVYQEFMSAASIEIDDTRLTPASDRTWAGIGVGGSYSWQNDKYSLYGQGSFDSSLKNFGKSYQVKGTVGFKVNW